jgi:hypothetical protein
LKLCNFFSLLQCVVLSPSQSLNLKALMRTLDETKVSSFQGVVGGETLVVFLHRLRAERAEREEPFAEGQASASFSTGGGRGTHARAPVCNDRMESVSGDRVGSVSGDRVGSVSGDRVGSICGDRMGRFCGDCVGSVCGDRMGRLYWRPHGALLRRPHGFHLRRLRGAFDMLHRNEEHALKSLHVD